MIVIDTVVGEGIVFEMYTVATDEFPSEKFEASVAIGSPRSRFATSLRSALSLGTRLRLVSSFAGHSHQDSRLPGWVS